MLIDLEGSEEGSLLIMIRIHIEIMLHFVLLRFNEGVKEDSAIYKMRRGQL